MFYVVDNKSPFGRQQMHERQRCTAMARGITVNRIRSVSSDTEWFREP